MKHSKKTRLVTMFGTRIEDFARPSDVGARFINYTRDTVLRAYTQGRLELAIAEEILRVLPEPSQ